MSEAVNKEVPPAAERRKPRKKTFLRGLAVSRDGSQTMDCRIEDLSAGGARLSFNKGRELPPPFYLLVTGKEVAFDTEIVWVKGLERGIKFIGQHQMEAVKNTELQFLRRLKLERLRA